MLCRQSVDVARTKNITSHTTKQGTHRWCFHQSLTIVYQQSFAHNTHDLLIGIVCVVIGLPTHFWLQTYLSRITHILLYWTIFVLLSQHKQFIRVNPMLYIAHTPWSAWLFLLCCLITNSSSEWTVCCISHTPSSGCPLLLFPLLQDAANTTLWSETLWRNCVQCINHRWGCKKTDNKGAKCLRWRMHQTWFRF